MSSNTVIINANNQQVQIGWLRKKRGVPSWKATIYIFAPAGSGTFGGGTVTLYASPDGGTTLIALPDIGGNPGTVNANSILQAEFCASNSDTNLVPLYAKITGSTSPLLSVRVDDNSN